jgi:hypothetical protein
MLAAHTFFRSLCYPTVSYSEISIQRWDSRGLIDFFLKGSLSSNLKMLLLMDRPAI